MGGFGKGLCSKGFITVSQSEVAGDGRSPGRTSVVFWVRFLMIVEGPQRAEAEGGLSDRPPVVMSRGSRDQVF